MKQSARIREIVSILRERGEMTVEEAVNYADFLHQSALALSKQPRDEKGQLLRTEDLVMAKTLYDLVDEHEQVCRRLLSHD